MKKPEWDLASGPTNVRSEAVATGSDETEVKGDPVASALGSDTDCFTEPTISLVSFLCHCGR